MDGKCTIAAKNAYFPFRAMIQRGTGFASAHSTSACERVNRPMWWVLLHVLTPTCSRLCQGSSAKYLQATLLGLIISLQLIGSAHPHGRKEGSIHIPAFSRFILHDSVCQWKRRHIYPFPQPPILSARPSRKQKERPCPYPTITPLHTPASPSIPSCPPPLRMATSSVWLTLVLNPS